MTSLEDWVAGARPRTLWTAVTAVAVGSASAAAVDSFRLEPALFALGVGVALQVASNYANDYADGVRGTDVNRLGPERLVASGRAAPSAVKKAAFIAFGVGAALGLYVVILSAQWWLLAVGALAIVAAWTYTASPRPYGYAGWGEVSVLFFFGPVAVLGTMLVQAKEVTWWAVAASFAVGLWAVALLMINNIRDIDGDALAGKRTLAVQLGARRARTLFGLTIVSTLVLAVVIAFEHPWVLLTFITAAPTVFFALAMRLGPQGLALRPFFSGVSLVGLVYGLLLALGLAL